jgi:hypothetical protein
MKKGLIIIAALITGAFIGMRINDYSPLKAYDDMYWEKRIWWSIDECVPKGLIDIDNPNDADSEKCVETICGEKISETSEDWDKLDRCYMKNITLPIYIRTHIRWER